VDGRGQVRAADEGGRSPGEIRLGERVRDHVLLDAVDPVSKGITGAVRPRTGHDLPRTPAVEERVGLPGDLADARAHHVRVEVRHRPSAVLEPAVGVLFGATGRLHHAVEADELAHADLHPPTMAQNRSAYRRRMAELKTGDKAPAISLKDQD